MAPIFRDEEGRSEPFHFDWEAEDLPDYLKPFAEENPPGPESPPPSRPNAGFKPGRGEISVDAPSGQFPTWMSQQPKESIGSGANAISPNLATPLFNSSTLRQQLSQFIDHDSDLSARRQSVCLLPFHTPNDAETAVGARLDFSSVAITLRFSSVMADLGGFR